jgi:uncharacterized membrane protein
MWPGQHGHPPQLRHQGLGHASCVIACGWGAIHQPGSPDISLKLFTISNIGRAAVGIKTVKVINKDGFQVQECLKELADMGEVKAALQNLCLAAKLAALWNFFFKMLDTFQKATMNMEQELNGYRKAAIVSAFIDHCLLVNANWVQDQDFLNIPNLRAMWESWWGARKASWRSEVMAAAQNINV